MESISILLIEIFGICLLFGAIYPICAIIIYPFYRLFGGKVKFLEYVRSL